MNEDPSAINETFSNLLDFTRKDVKAFINEFIERIKTQKRYQEEAKQV